LNYAYRLRVLHPWKRKPTGKKRLRSRKVAGRITPKTEVKGMELAMAMEMDWVRVAQDSAVCCKVGDELSISIKRKEFTDYYTPTNALLYIILV
jgi:hypothetical protein